MYSLLFLCTSCKVQRETTLDVNGIVNADDNNPQVFPASHLHGTRPIIYNAAVYEMDTRIGDR